MLMAVCRTSATARSLSALGPVAPGVEITFWQYCKVGVPVTLLTLVFGMGWLG
jgi:Na+/H+ antiporter NhaD/arsenite permease-like protein